MMSWSLLLSVHSTLVTLPSTLDGHDRPFGISRAKLSLSLAGEPVWPCMCGLYMCGPHALWTCSNIYNITINNNNNDNDTIDKNNGKSSSNTSGKTNINSINNTGNHTSRCLPGPRGQISSYRLFPLKFKCTLRWSHPKSKAPFGTSFRSLELIVSQSLYLRCLRVTSS